jgi:hypothetical protein
MTICSDGVLTISGEKKQEEIVGVAVAVRASFVWPGGYRMAAA